jgi:hypothetical protein
LFILFHLFHYMYTKWWEDLAIGSCKGWAMWIIFVLLFFDNSFLFAAEWADSPHITRPHTHEKNSNKSLSPLTPTRRSTSSWDDSSIDVVHSVRERNAKPQQQQQRKEKAIYNYKCFCSICTQRKGERKKKANY